MSTEIKEDAKPKQTDNWADMSDGQPEEEETADKQHVIKPAKKKAKGFKNKQGDYVVTSIDIPDMRSGMKKDGEAESEEESDSDTEYDEEDDVKEAVKEEEKSGKYIHKLQRLKR